MVDHSKRVSAREDVQAFYDAVGRGEAKTREWLGRRPLRRFLRKQPIFTWLSLAGIVLSIGALMVLIGIGEAQIAASEGHKANLDGRPLFYLGLCVAGFGILALLVAIAASNSEGRAKREFPALDIFVNSVGEDSDSTGNRVMSPLTEEWSAVPAMAFFGVVIANRERARTADLIFRLSYPPGDHWTGTLLFGPPRKGVPAWLKGHDLVAFPAPLHLEPERTEMGDLLFELPSELYLPVPVTAEILVFDHGSGKLATLKQSSQGVWTPMKRG